MALGLLVSIAVLAVQSPHAVPSHVDAPGLFTCVRATETFVIALIQEGHRRSPPFRGLVDRFQQSNLIVSNQPAVVCQDGLSEECEPNVYGNARGSRGTAPQHKFADAQSAVRVPDGVTSSPRVRSTDAAILELLNEGGERSKTFRALLDTIAQSRVIVHVEWGYCAFGHLNGCLLFIASSHGDRYLRILVKSRRSHDQLIAVIAHELRHAVEVSQQDQVVDAATFEALYRRIGTPLGGSLRGYETSAARTAGDIVLSELSKTRTGR